MRFHPFSLCAFGIGVYAALARLFRVDEISEVQLLLLRKLRLKQEVSTTAV